MEITKIPSTLALLIPLTLAVGCTYQQRHPETATVPTYGSYGDTVISVPASPTPPSPVSQGAGASQLMNDSDRVLVQRVREQFSHYGDLAAAASNLDISAHDGRVILMGTVPTERDRRVINALVQNTTGVTSLNDQLTLRPVVTTSNSNPIDSSLASRVREALRNQPTLANVTPNVQVTENNGTVTLTGSVPTEEDRNLIESVIKNTVGVTAINDGLTIAPSATGRRATVPGDIFNLHVQGLSAPDRTLAQRILDGLRTDSMLGNLLPSVDIQVAGGKVTLQGTVQTEQQKQAILSAVQRAAGVDNVQDELQVQTAR
jgi:hyperosmotically inducible periplasmic protein